MKRLLLVVLTMCAGNALAAPTRSTKEMANLAVNLESQPKVDWTQYRFLSFDAGQDLAKDQAAVKMVVATMNRTKHQISDVIIEVSPLIYAVNVKKLAWPAAAWEEMSQEWVYYTSAPESLKRRLKSLTGSSFPIMRADVFVEDAWAAKWYEQFMNLPKTRMKLIGDLKVKLDKPLNVGVVSKSTVTVNPGKVARYETPDGLAVWVRMNYANCRGENNSVEHPHNLVCHYNEVTFELPSGLDAYASYDGEDGKLSRFSDTKIATGKDGGVVELGRSCFECHRSGARDLKHADHPNTLNLADQIGMRRLYDPVRMGRAVKADRDRWAVALKKINGLTPPENSRAIDGIVGRFKKSMKIDGVASEFGVTVSDLKAKLTASGRPALVKFADGGEWSRTELESHWPAIMKLYRQDDVDYLARK